MNNNNLREELMNLGFEEKYIKQACQSVNTMDEAINLILALQDAESNPPAFNQNPMPMQQPQMGLFANIDAIPFDIDFSNLQLPNFADNSKQYKMVFLVRMDLKMGVGKIAAQTGHAVLGAYQRIVSRPEQREALEGWENCGQAKIVLKVESLQELMDIERKAKELNLNTYTVQDAGRTQVEPGSLTVCAIGPGETDRIDQVTKHLKLL